MDVGQVQQNGQLRLMVAPAAAGAGGDTKDANIDTPTPIQALRFTKLPAMAVMIIRKHPLQWMKMMPAVACRWPPTNVTSTR
jgi:hypothetical protein